MSSLKKVELDKENQGEKSWAWQIPQPREVTISALAMLPSHLVSPQQSLSVDAFARLARLHLYYAKMDEALVSTLIRLSQLSHLRLTRPFSENLSEAAFQLLDKGGSKLECLIVEAGIYMDDRTMARLNELQDSASSRGRLQFIKSETQKPTATENLANIDEASSTTHVINWVTSSEERGFHQFSRRARGDEGVWSG